MATSTATPTPSRRPCREAVDYLILTGDFVGYYYSPAEVLALLDPWPRAMVRGNHEDMLARTLREPSSIEEYTLTYGHGLQVAMRELSLDQLRQLTTLPERVSLEMDGLRILVAHGTPWEPDTYLYPDAPQAAWERFAEVGADIVVLGHTHYPMNRHVHGWALLDTRGKACTFFREPYDAASVCDTAARLDPGLPYLREVLYRV